MTSPEILRELEVITGTEAELIDQSLQRTTVEYREAIRLDEEEGGHLQRVVVETPEPTIAYRMDSKKEFLLDGQVVNSSLYFYVPEDASPESWLDRFWIKTVEKDGIEAVYYINREHGVGIHEMESDIELVIQEAEAELHESDGLNGVESLDVDPELMTMEIIKSKRRTIKGLKILAKAVRSEFTHVKFEA